MEFTGGLPETRCGLGSTLAFTEQLRPRLERLFYFLGVRSIVDAPCGDFNWMSRTNLSQVKYTGIDADRENLLRATQLSQPSHYAPRRKVLLELDLVTAETPLADLILCRDFLQHLPIDMVHRVIYNFRRSGSRWLLATNHEGGDNAGIASPGAFHRLDLTHKMFALGDPLDRLPDGDQRTLALWEINKP